MSRSRRTLNPTDKRGRRAARDGDEAAVLAEQLRRGEISQDELERRIEAGDRLAAQVLYGTELREGDIQVLAWARANMGRRKKIRNAREGERLLAVYLRATGWSPAGGNATGWRRGSSWIKFKQQNYEELRGKPGSWRKVDSASLKQTAQDILDGALERGRGQTGAREKTRQGRAKAKQRVVSAREKRAVESLALRAGIVFASLDLSPEQRAAVLADDEEAVDHFEALVRRLTPEPRTIEGVTEAQIDSQLSVDQPPLFLKTRGRGGFVEYPVGKFVFFDAQSQSPVTIRRPPSMGQSVEIEIGNMPVSMEGKIREAELFLPALEGGRYGVSGGVKLTPKSKLPYGVLFMIMSRSQRRGEGTSYLRAFCRLLAGYGLSREFVAKAVGPEGLVFLRALDRRSDVTILDQVGRDLIVSCEEATTPAGQQLMFAEDPRRNPACWDCQ